MRYASYVSWIYRGFVYAPFDEVEIDDDNVKVWHYVTRADNSDVLGYIEYTPYSYLSKPQFEHAIEYILEHKTHENKAFTQLAKIKEDYP